MAIFNSKLLVYQRVGEKKTHQIPSRAAGQFLWQVHGGVVFRQAGGQGVVWHLHQVRPVPWQISGEDVTGLKKAPETLVFCGETSWRPQSLVYLYVYVILFQLVLKWTDHQNVETIC